MWVAARLLPQREHVAQHCLALAGYTVYLPRIRSRRIVRGRKIETTPPLFPSYAFIAINEQWHTVRWSPGVASLVMLADQPARVPEAVIADLKARENGDGLIELPPRDDPARLKRGDPIRVTRGPLIGLEGLYAGQAPQQRVLILLSLLGARRPVMLAAADVAAAR